MNSVFARIHIPNLRNDCITVKDIDFEENVSHLKSQIAKIITYDENCFDIIYRGRSLQDDQKLQGLLRPKSIVHCFHRNTPPKPYEAPKELDYMKAVEIFKITSNVQISVNSRVNILQKILTEYPEFRRNLGAQALIRDSVLFSSLNQVDTMRNIAQNYPIIVEAAPFIVDTIKKELLRAASDEIMSELATESTTSSEEENTANSSSSSTSRIERLRRLAEAIGNEGRSLRQQQQSSAASTEHPLISRQHLQAALAGISGGNLNSNNSLANIAQRNTSDAMVANPLSSPASEERLTQERLRHELHAALSAVSNNFNTTLNNMGIDGDTSTSNTTPSVETNMSVVDDEGIPTQYRNHQYAQQLQTLAQMGFIDFEENINFLNITEGNIEMAINLLMGSMN